MQEYVTTRINKEKLKLQNIGATLELEPASLMFIDSKMIEGSKDDDSIRKMSIDTPDLESQIINEFPKNLVDLDQVANNRDIIDRPIQWVAGMMEVQIDPMSKIQ